MMRSDGLLFFSCSDPFTLRKDTQESIQFRVFTLFKVYKVQIQIQIQRSMNHLVGSMPKVYIHLSRTGSCIYRERGTERQEIDS